MLKKIFFKYWLILPPSEANIKALKKYRQETDELEDIELPQYIEALKQLFSNGENGLHIKQEYGQTLFLPGWIHAVYTAQKSVNFSGTWYRYQDLPTICLTKRFFGDLIAKKEVNTF